VRRAHFAKVAGRSDRNPGAGTVDDSTGRGSRFGGLQRRTDRGPTHPGTGLLGERLRLVHRVWARLVADHEDSAKIVVLDVTDEPSGKASVALAKEAGIVPFFQVNVGCPGTIGVLMPDGSPVEIFKGRLDKRDYDAALAKARQWIDDPASRPPPVAAETEGATQPPDGRGTDPS
jgi:hypothetical protein